MPGLSFAESMRGTFYFLTDTMREHAITIDIEARIRSIRNPIASVTGRIHAEGLTEGASSPIQDSNKSPSM